MRESSRTNRHLAEMVDHAILLCDMLGEERAIAYCENMGVPKKIYDRVFSSAIDRRPCEKSIIEIMEDINIL